MSHVWSELTIGLVPGQGSYRRGGLHQLLRDGDPAVRGVYAAVDGAAEAHFGVRVTDRIFSPSPPAGEELLENSPEVLQLAIYATSVSVFRLLESQGAAPSLLLGHSLGELAALVCAGAFDVSDGTEILCHRIAALRDTAAGDGHMLAIGCGTERAELILKLLDDPQLAIAVENAPDRVVVSGAARGIERAKAVAAAIGLATQRLPSPHPFHNRILEPARLKLTDRVRRYRCRPLTRLVYSPILGRCYRDGDDFAELLGLHLVLPVRFANAVQEMWQRGARVFTELGGGNALTRLVKTAHPDAIALTPLSTVDGTLRLRECVSRLRPLDLAETTPLAVISEPVASAPVEPVPVVVAAEPAPRMADHPSEDTVFAQVRTMFADELGYPEEVLTEDVELEAELGIDSVKRADLLGRLITRYELDVTVDSLRTSDYDTFGKVVGLVVGGRS